MVLTWFAATIFVVSGLQDLMYDGGAYVLALYRRIFYRDRERLTVAKLQSREEQLIAVMVPAWNEGDVVAAMVSNIIDRVQYKNYVIFVGTYPNDAATQAAVDALTPIHSHLLKVVNPTPGPTCKADCLNNVYQTIKAYEIENNVNFNIICMHDAEDVVHPYGFALYNYLIPRVDAIQLPILPLPTPHSRFVHWIYADEFCENHMKDVPVREKISGFVPFAGVGTGFSRRVFHALEQVSGHEIFNEKSMAEDYSMSKKLRGMGMKTIFVNVVLADDTSPWWTPLCCRPGFISNWAYFPFDFKRSVRQKTRWIIGISIQEWQHTGWGTDFSMYESLIKDRKVFAAATASMVGYIVFVYMVIAALGTANLLPVQLLPLLKSGTPITMLMSVATVVMSIRLAQRLIIISRVYGVAAGLMSLLRIPVSNLLNGLAAFRALQAFALERQGKAPVKWDKTMHVEGVGSLPTAPPESNVLKLDRAIPFITILGMLRSTDKIHVQQSLVAIPKELSAGERGLAMAALEELSMSTDTEIRATVSKSLCFLEWTESAETIRELLKDSEWVVRANAARALWKLSNPIPELEKVVEVNDSYSCEILVRCAENDRLARNILFREITQNDASPLFDGLVARSQFLTTMYDEWMVLESVPLKQVA